MKIKDAKWEMTDDEIGMKPKFRIFCQDCFWENVFMSVDELMEDVRKSDGVGFFVAQEKLAFERAFGVSMLKAKNGHFDMELREVFCSPLPFVGKDAYHNDMHYKHLKSNGCDRVKVFGVPIDEEYYKELMKRRKGKGRILPREEWDKDAGIKRQLESMGYI